MASLSSTMFSTVMLPRKPVAVSATSLRSLSNFKQATPSASSPPPLASPVWPPTTSSSSLWRVVSIECPDDVYVLDHADEVGYELPYSCRAGSCSSCTDKVVGGSIDQVDDSFLDDDQIGEGWVLTCVAYPTSDQNIRVSYEYKI
ncbi:hypothetical protein DH2020_027700 [Rehmannia glutinosa]|uniref:Ferredoxin n=1 Tax=Rehmannia glutinosa TaxID=99300 RepID=A0ABR0VWW6_REHGL